MKNDEWSILAQKLIAIYAERGISCAVSGDATEQDLRNLIALSAPVYSTRWRSQSEILKEHGIGPSAELTKAMPRFKRHKIGACRS